MTTDEKNEVFAAFVKKIKRSWTWERLTEEERARCLVPLRELLLTGSRDQATANLYVVYMAYLYGLGYEWTGWREPDEKPLF